jgi:hypothetical protein
MTTVGTEDKKRQYTYELSRNRAAWDITYEEFLAIEDYVFTRFSEAGDLEDGIEFARGVDDKGEFTVFRTDPVVRAAARE